MTFGRVLRLLRGERGMTQRQLAEVFGVSESTIGMYERDQREPDFDTLQAIADYFRVDMDYLTGRSAERRAPAPEEEDDFPQVRLIARAGRKMTEADREKMLQLLKVAFPDKFSDD